MSKVLIVIPKTKKAQADAICVEMFGRHAENTFRVPILEGASQVSNHYAACLNLTPEQVAVFESEIPPTRVVLNTNGKRDMVAAGFRHVPSGEG